MNRCSGILMPVFSLPSPYGIGTLGKAAYDFADFLHAAGQRCWQMLPLGPTSYGDSPYQSFSTYAGNPYFIDLDMLIEDGLLEKSEVQEQNWGTEPRYVDYGKIYESRFAVLQKAKDRGVQLLLPTDTVAAAEFSADADSLVVPTDAIREQLHNKAACRVIKAMLDKRGHADAYGLDDTLSRHRMLTIAKEKLGLADLRAIDARIAAAQKLTDSMTAWRIEGTLREFARFDPVNLWFDYPVHKPDTGLLEDLQPDSDYKSLGTRGASKRWGNKDKVSKDKKAELDTAFEACMMDGEVTVYSLAEYMDLKPRTVKTRLKDDGRFWIDGEKVGRKEPGSAG